MILSLCASLPRGRDIAEDAAVLISRRLRAIAALLMSLAMLVSSSARANQEPLWEAGLGVGVVAFPDYRGSDQERVYPVPVPYFIYRGEFFKADRNGVREEFLKRDWVELSLSGNATIPTDKNDHARSGMPDLRTTLELGPDLEFHLWRSKDSNVKFDVEVPVRFPITVQSPPQSLGWDVAPRVDLNFQNFVRPDWHFGIGAGPVYAARKYNEYFYSVTPQYATPSRPTYAAPGGYSGAQFVTALTKRFPKFWVGAFIRYDELQGAVFGDSPLVKQRYGFSGGVGMAWMIGESSRRVEADD
jgi:MipA family protein